MDFGISGRTALIFGGSKGLGRGVAEALAGEGVRLVLVARGRAALDAAAAEIGSRAGVPVVGIPADLTDPAAIDALIPQARAALGGRIDILLNNTGGPPPGPVAGVSPAAWSEHFAAMVLSVFRITEAVLPDMRRNGWGRILTVGSTTVVEPNPALGMSNTLRSALVGWSKTLAGEVAADNVTVNLLLPGQIGTDRTDFLDARAAAAAGVPVAEIRRGRTAAIPAGRYGTPAEFGAVAAFLASAQAAYVTGSAIRVDGGAVRAV